MRRSLRSFGPAALAVFLAFAPGAAVFAEDAEFDNASADGSQIEPAGPDMGPQRSAKNLNTVPEDGLGSSNAVGPDNLFVRKLVAARPNEDLVICVAGCFSGRDRVVYAQPAEKFVRTHTIAPQSSLEVAPSQNFNAPALADGVLKPSKAAAAEPQVTSQYPQAPVVLNRTN